MKVIILAGGFGTRLSEYTKTIPKPMVNIGAHPILWHIMKRYADFDHKDFYLALGYKSEVIKEYFLHYHYINSDFTIELSNGETNIHKRDEVDWSVTLIQTGVDSMTGGRVKRMQSFIGNETCLLTYGDGLSSINFDELIAFHRSHGKMVTISAVHPDARFGEMKIEGDQVISFKEKPQVTQGWVNGGFFVIEPDFFDLIEGDMTILEKDPIEKAVEIGELMVYRHNGFWQCMDTRRDREYLEKLWRSKDTPWL